MNKPEVTDPSVHEATACTCLRSPKFNTPQRVVTDGFWSNLKQFLTEKPIKVNPNVHSTLMPEEYGGGFSENLKDFFKSKPVPKGPLNSRLAVNWGTNFGGFGYRLKEFFSPTKQPPLPPGIQPVKVKDIWTKDENFGWTQIIAFCAHIAVIALLVVPLIWWKQQPAAANTQDGCDAARYLAVPGEAACRRDEGWRRRWRKRSHADAAEQGPTTEV